MEIGPLDAAIKILDEIATLLPDATWREEPMTDLEALRYHARTFIGHVRGWRIVVTDFDIADQGFPVGSRGYDGAATGKNTVIHLPRALAERAFKLALGKATAS